MDMRYVDANQTNNRKRLEYNGDEYVHMIRYMPVKYIQCLHIQLTGLMMTFLFGNEVRSHNATQVRESWLWGRVADMMELEWG